MSNAPDPISIETLLGPWVEPDWASGLMARCKAAWSKPLPELTNQELAMFLRQRIAVSHLVPLAKKRIEDRMRDDTESYDGELEAAIQHATD